MNVHEQTMKVHDFMNKFSLGQFVGINNKCSVLLVINFLSPFNYFLSLGINLFHNPTRAMQVLYDGGLVVEPSGAAAFAAFLGKKVPDVQTDSDVVIFLTGSNVTIDELNKHIGNGNNFNKNHMERL